MTPKKHDLDAIAPELARLNPGALASLRAMGATAVTVTPQGQLEPHVPQQLKLVA